MKRLGLDIQKVKAIFVSHEHSDHIRGICGLVKKQPICVYITAPTLIRCGFAIEKDLVSSFATNEPIMIGDLKITAFPKLHDACDPYSFTVSSNGINVGVFTDIGFPCKQLIHHFKQCHAAFLEANYDEQMLDTGNYPYHLKKRIRSGKGHLSNVQALEVFTKHKPAFMSHLLLAHLSKNNNCPQLVEDLFSAHSGGVKVVVASRYEETPVFHIQHPGKVVQLPQRNVASSQLAFSFA